METETESHFIDDNLEQHVECFSVLDWYQQINPDEESIIETVDRCFPLRVQSLEYMLRRHITEEELTITYSIYALGFLKLGNGRG